MQWSRDYTGLPFKNMGRDRSGVDCYGLVRLVLAEQFGQHVPIFSGISAGREGRHECAAVFGREMQRWKRVEPGRQQPGDVVVLNIFGQPRHCGIVLSRNEMLHVMEGRETCIEQFDNAIWRKRVVGFYRWEAVDASA